YGHINATTFLNNKKPLLELYTSLTNKDKHTPSEYVVFMHDDLHIVDLEFAEKLDLGFQLFDYFGVAGSNMMQVSEPRWHQTPNANKKTNHGLMEHQTLDGKRYMTSFGPYPATCPIFDGVFMAFKWEVLEKLQNVPELDGFHLYDMEMCTQAYDLGYKGGVMGIHMFHESRGEGILTSDWQRYANIYTNKWKDKYKIIGA
ncbi:MAG TPA: glycosyltransferase, partial [Methanosarcinales archaeon]|nr:glycosyltransferase [Methanosarcinales archaeon]